MTFAANLKAARRAACMTQSELAKQAGIPASLVQGFETGQLVRPSVGMASRIAQALGANVEDLTGQVARARGAQRRQDAPELLALVLECPEAFVEATLVIRRIRRGAR